MRIVIALLVLFGFTLSGAMAQSVTPSNTKPDWLIIPAQSTASARHLIITVEQASKERLSAFLETLERKYRVDVVAEWPLASIQVHCYVLKVERGSSVDDTIQELERDGDIRTVQTMRQFRTLGRVVYKDDLFALQTNLDALNVVPAHTKFTGRDVKIAVIDTGIDTTHPDFTNRNIEAKDFVGVGAKRTPKEKHGTAIAGVIAASNDNGKGIVGVAPDAEVFGMRGCWQLRLRSRGRCSSFSLARAINFAILNDIDVINLSLGGPFDPLLAELIDKAVTEHGILVVAAYGDNPKARFPADQKNVIGVSVKKRSEGNLITAPGVDILSTSPGGKYDFYSGSSVATAHVSGVAALMLEANRNLKPKNIFKMMKKSSTKSEDKKFFNACEIISNIESLNCI